MGTGTLLEMHFIFSIILGIMTNSFFLVTRLSDVNETEPLSETASTF